MTLFSRAAQVAVASALGLAIALAGCSPAAAPHSEHGPIIASTPGVAQTAPNAAQPVPPYYAAIWAARSPAWSSPQNVTIRDTDTARTLLTVRPPAPYQTFSFVAGTGVAGRWVVGAQRWHSQLFIREASGALRQIPWPGFIHIPKLLNIIEPDVAW